MWQGPFVGYSRQPLVDSWTRGSVCTCHAKRYTPARQQRKANSGAPIRGGTSRRKPSDSAPTDEDDLLRELNRGGAGLLQDEDEQDWGLDDVAAHAKARQQQQTQPNQRLGGSAPETGGSRWGAATAAGMRRRGGAGAAGGAAAEHLGSPLESGLASISITEEEEEEDGDGPSALTSAPQQANLPTPRSAFSASAGGRLTGSAVAPAARRSRPIVELDASYARRNPEVVQALKLRGMTVRVRQPDGADDDAGDEEEEAGFYAGRRGGRGREGLDPDLGLDEDFDLSNGEDGLDLMLDSDLAAGDDGDLPSGSSSIGRGIRAGGSGRASTVGAPSGGKDWYGSLAAAGFSVRTNAAGEVFLERTVRRKAATSAAATAAAANGDASSAAASRRSSSGGGATAAGTTTAAAGGVADGAAGAAAALQGPLVAPLEPLSGRPAIVAALQRLTTPQHVLDFLELSYSEWAANGYRLADMSSDLPVAAPTPAEAAHCLRALAVTARRADIGGWRCLELAAGRQTLGLAEALRVAPPRLLPEHASPQLSAAYFDAARRYWLEAAADQLIGDPRVGRARAAATSSSRPAGDGSDPAAAAPLAVAPTSPMSPALLATDAEAAAAAEGLAGDGADLLAPARSPDDPMYDSLVAKYAAISRRRQFLDMARGSSEQQSQQLQGPLLNGYSKLAAASAAAAPASAGPVSAPQVERRTELKDAAASAAASEAVERRAAKIECLVSALWAMSSLGGPPYFQTEVEAAVTILVRCLASATASSSAAAPLATEAAAGGGSGGGLTGWQSGQVLWALGNSRHATPRLADLEASILRAGGLAAMQPRDVTRVLWGFASLGHRPERLLLTIRPDWSWWERQAGAPGAAAGETPRRGQPRGRRSAKGSGGGEGARGDVRSFTPQQLAGAVWALAVMEQVDTVPFRSAWTQLLRRASEVPPAEPVLTQIWQANLAIHLEASVLSAAPAKAVPQQQQGRSGAAAVRQRAGAAVAAEDLTAAGLAAASPGQVDAAAARSLLLRARDVFLAATSGLRRKVQSGYQRQIANTLTGLRMMHLLEDNSVGYAIDITLPQLRIALEADGPTHTSRTPGGAVLGATAMKRRHLQRLGWRVLSVTYKEWDKLTSESSRREFLQARINEALLSGIQLVEEAEEEG